MEWSTWAIPSSPATMPATSCLKLGLQPYNPMKKQLLVAIALVLSVLGAAQAQTALFIYNDGNGAPNAGTYTPGSSFTFSINLAFTPGGAVQNLDGLSYWFTQQSPSGGPFPFAITLRDVTGS